MCGKLRLCLRVMLTILCVSCDRWITCVTPHACACWMMFLGIATTTGCVTWLQMFLPAFARASCKWVKLFGWAQLSVHLVLGSGVTCRMTFGRSRCVSSRKFYLTLGCRCDLTMAVWWGLQAWDSRWNSLKISRVSLHVYHAGNIIKKKNSWKVLDSHLFPRLSKYFETFHSRKETVKVEDNPSIVFAAVAVSHYFSNTFIALLLFCYTNVIILCFREPLNAFCFKKCSKEVNKHLILFQVRIVTTKTLWSKSTLCSPSSVATVCLPYFQLFRKRKHKKLALKTVTCFSVMKALFELEKKCWG